MKLKNKKSYINKSLEGVAPNRPAVKITHKIYLLVLMSVLSYFAYSVYLSLITYEGVGHVRVNKTLLSSSYDGEIIQLPIEEGDDVTKDTLLVRLKSATACQVKEIKKEKEIAQFENELQLNRLRIDLLKNQIASLTESEYQLTLRRALELDDRSFKDRRLVQGLENDLSLLTKELVMKQAYLDGQYGQDKNNCPDEFLYAPFDGTVKRVFLKVNEFSSRGEGLVLIQPRDASVRIEAFVNKNDMQHLRIKQNIEIIFPDNVTSLGVIDEFLSSAHAFPKLEWNDYEPSDARIRIHISPVNNVEASLWKKYDLLRVRIRGQNR